MAVNSFEKQVALALQRTVDLSKRRDEENQSAFDGTRNIFFSESVVCILWSKYWYQI